MGVNLLVLDRLSEMWLHKFRYIRINQRGETTTFKILRSKNIELIFKIYQNKNCTKLLADHYVHTTTLFQLPVFHYISTTM